MDHAAHAHHAPDFLTAGLDPLSLVGTLSIFSFSLLASWHCALMCGPLVCATLGSGPSLRKRDLWLYQAGRAASYILAGALLGALGSSILSVSAWVGRLLALAIAALLAVVGILLFFGKKMPSLPDAGARLLATKALGRIKRWPRSLYALGLGWVTVLLPCMTLTPVLTLAGASASPWRGAALLAAFHAGTVPATLLAALVPSRLQGVLPEGAARRMAAVFLLLGSAATIFRVFH